MAHLLGAESPAPGVPDQGRLRRGHARHRRGRPDRRRRPQRRRQVEPAAAARRRASSPTRAASPAAAACRSACSTRATRSTTAATVGARGRRRPPEHEWAGDARIRDVIAGLLADIPWDARSATCQRRPAAPRRARGAADRRLATCCSSTSPPTTSTSRAIAWLADHLKRRWPAARRRSCRDPRPVVPRRGLHRDVGGARPHRRAVRRRLRRLRPAARASATGSPRPPRRSGRT